MSGSHHEWCDVKMFKSDRDSQLSLAYAGKVLAAPASLIMNSKVRAHVWAPVPAFASLFSVVFWGHSCARLAAAG